LRSWDSPAGPPDAGSRRGRRRALHLALSALICIVLVEAGPASAGAKTLHLTATVAKDKVTRIEHSQVSDQVNNTVTFDLRSGGRAAGQMKGSCNGPGNFFQCINLSGWVNGIGTNLGMSVKWVCSFTHPGCAADATGLVTSKGAAVGKVTFRTTTKGALTVGNRFPVDIVLGKFCQPTVISPGVQLVPKGC
jgi:hypothetical protein